MSNNTNTEQKVNQATQQLNQGILDASAAATINNPTIDKAVSDAMFMAKVEHYTKLAVGLAIVGGIGYAGYHYLTKPDVVMVMDANWA